MYKVYKLVWYCRRVDRLEILLFFVPLFSSSVWVPSLNSNYPLENSNWYEIQIFVHRDEMWNSIFQNRVSLSKHFDDSTLAAWDDSRIYCVLDKQEKLSYRIAMQLLLKNSDSSIDEGEFEMQNILPVFIFYMNLYAHISFFVIYLCFLYL